MNACRVLQIGLIAMVAMVVGCESSQHRKMQAEASTKSALRARTMAGAANRTEVYLQKLYVHVYPMDKVIPVDLRSKANGLGPSMPTNMPLTFQNEALLRVMVHDGGQTEKFDMLVGPNPATDFVARVTIGSNVSASVLTEGWAILSGRIPVGKTRIVETTPEGTVYALAIAPHVDISQEKHVVAVLSGVGVTVKLRETGETKMVASSKSLTVRPTQSTLPTPAPASEDSELIQYIKERATKTGLISP